MKVKSLSRVRLLATPWTAAHQAPLSMGFPKQEYWSGLLFPPSGNLLHPRIEPLQAESLMSEGPIIRTTTGSQGEQLCSFLVEDSIVAVL